LAASQHQIVGRAESLDCSDLGRLVFLRSGDGALTRRAKKASRLSAVVVRWSQTRKRYERQGAREGFDDSRIRTVSDNATTLKFDQCSFETD